MKNTVIIIGPQGSGKSTLATLLAHSVTSHGNSRGDFTTMKIFDESEKDHRASVGLEPYQMQNYGEVAGTDVYLVQADIPEKRDVAPGSEFFETADTKLWARGWLATIAGNPSIPYDEDAMIGWFANAIMKGWDLGQIAASFDIDPEGEYHELAMRTAAGPDVFHYSGSDEDKDALDNIFLTDMVDYLRAAAKMDDWKSRLFYGKPKYGRAELGDVGWQRDLPDYADFMEGERSLDFIHNPQLIHAILGIATEGAELMEDLATLTQPGSYGVGTWKDNIVRETGDVDWYQELLATAIGTPVDQSRNANIERLRKRYPEKFSEADALERKDEMPVAEAIEEMHDAPENPMTDLVGEIHISDEDKSFVALCENHAGEAKREGESLVEYIQRLRRDY